MDSSLQKNKSMTICIRLQVFESIFTFLNTILEPGVKSFQKRLDHISMVETQFNLDRQGARSSPIVGESR